MHLISLSNYYDVLCKFVQLLIWYTCISHIYIYIQCIYVHDDLSPWLVGHQQSITFWHLGDPYLPFSIYLAQILIFKLCSINEITRLFFSLCTSGVFFFLLAAFYSSTSCPLFWTTTILSELSPFGIVRFLFFHCSQIGLDLSFIQHSAVLTLHGNILFCGL